MTDIDIDIEITRPAPPVSEIIKPVPEPITPKLETTQAVGTGEVEMTSTIPTTNGGMNADTFAAIQAALRSAVADAFLGTPPEAPANKSTIR